MDTTNEQMVVSATNASRISHRSVPQRLNCCFKVPLPLVLSTTAA